MRKLDICRFSVVISMVISIGCTDVNPSVGLLRAVDGFEFKASQITISSLYSVPLEATCPSYIQKVEMSFDGTNWMNPSDYDSNSKSICENGTFKITLSDTKTPWKSTTFTKGQTVTVSFRASRGTEFTIVREVKITYKPSSTISQEILAGANIQTGSGLKLRGRVRAQHQAVASGGSYKIRGRIVQ